ncbi:MAG: Rrf2 family transcriptional regulator, partial [Nitrospirales bacterium]
AYFHQHPSAYLLHLSRKHQTPLFREYHTLALLTHITRRFLTGKPPLKEEQLARAQRVPLTLVESLLNDLVKAKMIVRGDDPKGLVLAQAPENMRIVDVLRVVQHQPHGGPQAFAVGTDNISQLLMRRDAAIDEALEGITLRHLVKDQTGSLEQEQICDLPSSEDMSASASETSIEEIISPKTL